MIRIQGLHKFYNKGRPGEIHVLNDVTLDLPEKGMVAIFGKSGCGKTTLLNVIGGLDTFADGSLTVDGKSIREDTDALRNEYIGYIFQNYNLKKTDSCFENVAAALRLCGMENEEEIRERVMAALTNAGMEKYALRSPDTLSGGQQQRIAIARAIVKNPRIILADEPTGNLDEANTVMIMDLLKEISRDHLVLLVTHEESLVDFYCDRVIEISDGRVIGERTNASAEGYTARDKNHIFLGELSHSKIEGESTQIEYFGEKASAPIKLTVVNHGGKLYLQIGTPGVQVLDESSEIRLCEGVYKEKTKEGPSDKEIDMSKLPPVKGTRHGRLFSLRSSIKSGYFSSFKSKKRRGRALRACMSLFAAVIVFMSAIFGTAFGDLLEVKNAYNHNVFYVYTPDARTSEALNAAVGRSDTGIDFIRLRRYFPEKGDEKITFRTASFETFTQYDFGDGLTTNAVYLSSTLADGMKLLAGRRDGLAEEEILITSKVADALLEKSTLGYITEYKDLLGLTSNDATANGKSMRIGGIVKGDESAIYLSDIAMAKYVKRTFYSRYYALASDYGMTVANGEATLSIKSRAGLEELPELEETIKICGMDFVVTNILEQSSYDDFLSKQNLTKMTENEFFTAILKEEFPTLEEGTDAFEEAYTAIRNEHYFEYCDYYSEHIDAYLAELYFFREDDLDLWLYMEKGVEDVKFCYLPYYYFQATKYKEQSGSYPKLDEVSTLCADIPDVYTRLLEEHALYEVEFYSIQRGSGLYNITYLVSDADYVALSKRIGEMHPSATYYGGEIGYTAQATESAADYEYNSVVYTVIHSENPQKTERWLKEAFASLQDPDEYYKAIYTPDTFFDSLIREHTVSIVTNLVTLAALLVLMSLCMYFIMRSSLMSRIKEIGILRAIGVSKKNLLFKFFIEAAVLTVLTVFIAYLLTSAFMLASIGISPFATEIFYYPLWLAAADLVLLAAISLFFGTLPILTLLRKTPSEILSKYDI